MREIQVKTNKRTEFIDITEEVREEIRKRELQDGIALIYSPHTTAAVTINEGADPDVVRDILAELEKIVPFNGNYRHMEGNSAAHIKSSLIGAGEMVIIEDGEIQLGRWQSIYFCEFDGPRQRRVNLKVIPG